MELKSLASSKNKIELEIQGEDHTFVNLIRKELWNDKSVKAAGYHIEHTQTKHPVLIVKTKDKAPKKAIADAVNRLKKQTKQLLTLFKKVK